MGKYKKGIFSLQSFFQQNKQIPKGIYIIIYIQFKQYIDISTSVYIVYKEYDVEVAHTQ